MADQWLAECGMAIVHRLAGWDGLLLVAATLLAGVYAWIGARLLRAGLHLMPTILLLAVAMLAAAAVPRPAVDRNHRIAQRDIRMVGRRRERQPALRGNCGGLCRCSFCGRTYMAACWAAWEPSAFASADGALSAAWPLESVCHAPSDRQAGVTLPERARRPRSELAELIALLLALAATTLVSPYGVAMPRQWLDTLAMPLPKLIVEHGPLDLTESVGWGTLALAAGYLATLIGVFPQRPRITWLVPLVWFVLAVLRVRNAPLFGVTAVIALADMLPYSAVGRWLRRRDLLTSYRRSMCATAWNKQCVPARNAPQLQRSDWQTGQGFSGRALVLPAIVVAAAMMLKIGGVPPPVIGHGWARFDPAHWPIELLPTLDEINRSSPEGTRIFNDMNFGGFLIYHAPRLRVFIDDRCPL